MKDIVRLIIWNIVAFGAGFIVGSWLVLLWFEITNRGFVDPI